jgi:hypothetical protein
MTTAVALPEAASQLGQVLAQTAAALRRSVLDRAAGLARAGHLAEAERQLRECDEKGAADAASLDLLARIRVRQGRLAEAEALWLEASKLAPEDAGAADALAALRAELKRLGGFSRRWLVPAVLAVAAVLLIGWSAIRQERRHMLTVAAQSEQLHQWRAELGEWRGAIAKQSENLEQENRSLAAGVAAISDQLSTLSAEQAAVKDSVARAERALVTSATEQRNALAGLSREFAARLAAAERANAEAGQRQTAELAATRESVGETRQAIGRLAAKLDPPASAPAVMPEFGAIDGLKNLRAGDRQLLWSADGAFHRGLPLMRGRAEVAWRNLGAALHRADRGQLRIEVIGNAAEGAIFSAPDALAYRRAAAVARLLAASSGLPVEHIVARAATIREVAEQHARAANSMEAASVVVAISVEAR